MKESWKENQNFDQSKIELVPVEWVWKYRGTNPSKVIDFDDKVMDLEGLWSELERDGMKEPFIMRVGLKNKKFRLETGNHRIQVCKEHHVQLVPVIVQMKDECGPDAPDVMTEATHNFDWGKEVSLSEKSSDWMKPSDVFDSLKSNTIYV